MKKIPILFLSILISGSLFMPVSPTFAMMEDNNTTWWTVEEMLVFYQAVEAEKDLECGDNQDCKMEFNFTMGEKGLKYSALENFIQNQFWITSVNPANETIKVLFFDEDMMLKHMGIEEELSLEHLYIAWFENWRGQVYNDDYDHFYEGYIEGLHRMYAGLSSIDGPDWIPAWQEVELSVAGSNIINNTQGVITYSIFAENNMFNAQGSINYSKCFSAPDYEEGTECKMYISGDQWISFFPPREQIVEQIEQPNQDEVEPPLDDGVNDLSEWPLVINEPEEDNQEPEEIADNTQSSDEPEGNSESILLVASTNTIKAPETGKYSDDNSSIKEYGWLAILMAVGMGLIIWLFLPTKSQKSRKKYEKNKKRVLTK